MVGWVRFVAHHEKIKLRRGMVHYAVWFGIGLVQGFILTDWYNSKRGSKQAQTGSKAVRRA